LAGRGLVGGAAGVVGGLAAHVGVLDLHAEQHAVGTHAELVALQALVEEYVAGRAGDARRVEHHGAVQHDAVLLGDRHNAITTHRTTCLCIYIYTQYITYIRFYIR